MLATDRGRDGEALEGTLTLAPSQGVVVELTMSIDALDPLLSPEGFAFASTPPVAEGDPGRYHALFGRDSQITALQVLPARPEVAAATLRALAALQGERTDPETDEQPGKILHEHRPEAPAWHTEHGWPVRDGELRYYGSADSTPWFLVVLAALGDPEVSAELEPAWRAPAPGSSRRSPTAAGSCATGRASGPGGSPSRAGATSWARRARTPTAAASCAPTARRRGRRSPTPTCRRWPTRRCARSRCSRARRRGRGGPRRSPAGSRRTSGPA